MYFSWTERWNVFLSLFVLSLSIYYPLFYCSHLYLPSRLLGICIAFPSERTLRILKLADLSIKIMNLLAESAQSTALPPVTITACRHTPNPRALSTSWNKRVGQDICCVALLLSRLQLWRASLRPADASAWPDVACNKTTCRVRRCAGSRAAGNEGLSVAQWEERQITFTGDAEGRRFKRTTDVG